MTIEEFLKQCGLSDCRWERTDSDPDWPRYRVYVPHNQFEEAVSQVHNTFCNLFSVDVECLPPPLVDAEPGQFVMIYNDYDTFEESKIGVVASKQVVEGEVRYGCSYLQVGLGNRWVSDQYRFQLTTEDYGGYHKGFLKVLTPEEVIAVLNRQVEQAYQKELRRVETLRDWSLRELPKLVEDIGKGEVVQVSRWTPPEWESSVECKLRGKHQ